MITSYNLYCDESCHLLHDHLPVMVMGTVWCPQYLVKKINKDIRELKQKFHVNSELKWVKLSGACLPLYIEILNYFFQNKALHFRGLVIPNKKALRHDLYRQSHDEWYYKIYFDLIKTIIVSGHHKYNIYLDYKDSTSKFKIRKLHEILSNNIYDFNKKTINCIQSIQSHEVELMQITDLLIGALAYSNRELTSSSSKNQLIRFIQQNTLLDLRRSTIVSETKFNLFQLHLREFND